MNMLAALCEFFGTFLLLISIFTTGNAFIIGGTLALVILLTGSISGGHMNPAVSAAMWMKGAISSTEFLTYITAQYAGGIAAYYAYSSMV